jgi:hypothetical protein
MGLYQVTMTGDPVAWTHRESPEFFELDEDGRHLRHYARHERELRSLHSANDDVDEIVARQLRRLREDEAGDRIPRVVVKPARAVVLMLAESPEQAEQLARDANRDYHTIESVDCLDEDSDG